MAISITQQPQVLMPAYNNQWISALSDQIAQPGFYYIVQVVVNADTTHTLTENILQRPDGYMVFNAMEWVKNYVKHFFNPDLSLVSPIEIATNKTVFVEVTISEFYSGATHAIESFTYEAFDACLTENEFRNYAFADYTFGGTSGKWFLSKTVNTITPDNRVNIGSDLWLHFMQKQSALVDNIIITQFNGVTPVDTVSIASLPAPTNNYDMYVMNVGTKILSAPVEGDTVRVDFIDSLAVSLLRYTYTIADICSLHIIYQIYWLDRDGNILMFNFDKVSVRTENMKTTTVRLDPNVLTAGVYGSNNWDRELHSVSTDLQDSMVLNTDWVTEEQSVQLKELFNSPQRWLYDGDRYLPITVTQTSYEEKKHVNEKLFNYTINIDLEIKETRQRGL